jgi:hypothetical protein
VSSHVSFDSVDATMAMHAGIEKKMKMKIKNKNKVVNPNSMPGKISKHNCPVLSCPVGDQSSRFDRFHRRVAFKAVSACSYT